ncbi:MAG: cysteine desulfurase family protein [Eubacteriales bacterium]|nr:cysteine desulfurase family protein [Eubacteriales bacterium]MDD4540921.1 cysteine desulfurase family protein [Eubacteriales bacterium]
MSKYFDYTASAPIKQNVLDNYILNTRKCYANPTSSHLFGLESRKLIDEARQKIAKTLDCNESEIIFTSGGSEAINTALKGSAYNLSDFAPRRLITSRGEHDATKETALFLERYCDFETTWIGLEKTGELKLDEWQAAVEEKEHSLASFIYVSNETGAINDLRKIVEITRQANPRTLIHSDVVQIIGKLPFSFRKSGLDFASISGHKFGAPKSCGMLLVRDNKEIEPLIHGGGQQNNRRSGTEDAPLIYALAEAVELSNDKIAASYERVAELRERFLGLLKQFEVPHQVISPEDGLALVLTISFPGLRGETMQNALSAREIAVSTGSACHADQAGNNEVLAAMGFDKETIANSVRFSFNVAHTSKDIDLLAQTVCNIYKEYARP